MSAGQRNVAAVYPIDDHSFLRLTTPVRQNISITTRDDVRPTLEMVDIRTGSESLVGVAAENPTISVFGQSRANVPPRQLAVDSQGNAYAITVSGLSVISLAPTGTSSRPQLRGGARAIDRVLARRVEVELLEREGVVLGAPLQRLEADPFDVALLDLVMPRGGEALALVPSPSRARLAARRQGQYDALRRT